MSIEIVNLLVALTLGVVGYFAGRASEYRQFRLSATVFASDYFRDLRTWASEAIDVLSAAAAASQGRADEVDVDPTTCHECKHRLSALIDRGRFFIPNFNPDERGHEKPAAYQGIRHPALDLLVAAERVLAGTEEFISAFPSRRAALVSIKREFVSQIQEILDPRTQNRELALLLRDARLYPDSETSALERLSKKAHSDFSVD